MAAKVDDPLRILGPPHLLALKVIFGAALALLLFG
jgi:hypothetical protein